MEKSVESVFHPEIREHFLRAYQLDSTYKLLGDFENYVYEVTKDNQAFILRVTHSSHRLEEEVLGEIEWVNFLHSHDANVPVIYPSRHNKLVEKQIAENGTVFYASLFSKVNGSPVRANDDRFDRKLFYSWGKEIGKLHRLTEDFQPETIVRKQWYEDDLFEIEKYIPQEKMVIKRTKEIMEQLKELPKTSFGLIHNDVHHGNFFYDDDEIQIFDFDDACYFWYVSDIAIPLYYTCFSLFSDDKTDRSGKQEFARQFLDAFMEGYRQEINPPLNWEEQLSLFLKVRDITLYSALNKKITPESRSEDLQGQMQQIKQRIEQSEPIVSIN
ncbi:phosphotransferase enzyme family protein [Ornithinibacillus xuwenensis]|uniref:Phosphotransferase n=1 Tax=Ornithinibacillus xuwenensis TaxID=3144668 RepID=A0ABU9XHH9_9BACI